MMADAEQVSSTTPNEVEEDEMKRWSESGFRQATAQGLVQDATEGLFAGEQGVKDVRHVETEEEEVVMSRQEEMDLLHTAENKAETECLEKSADLISQPVECESPEEPDSTQMKEEEIEEESDDDTDTEESLKLVGLKEVEEAALITAAFAPPGHAFTPRVQDQDPVVSSATELQEVLRSHETLASAQPRHEVLFEPELEARDCFGVRARVNEEAFSEARVEPERAPGSAVEQGEGPDTRNPVAESFRIDSESTPAASASPSAYEPSLPSSAAPAPSFPTPMQFTSGKFSLRPTNFSF